MSRRGLHGITCIVAAERTSSGRARHVPTRERGARGRGARRRKETTRAPAAAADSLTALPVH
jgi:hypothetical protein